MRGVEQRERTTAELVAALRELTEAPPLFHRPDHWTSVLSSAPALAWVRKYNCLPAYQSGLAELAYDPKQDRLVFLIRDYTTNAIADAAGRSLDGTPPKWWRYGKSGLPFVCNPGQDMAVVVEDCASACAVGAAGYTGVCLLGTSLLATHLPVIRQSRRVVVALDPDAQLKAFSLMRRLSLWLPASMAMLRDDPKYFAPAQLKELIG